MHLTRLFPRGISHYTNLSGLMGILDSGTIWLSNVSFLNDRRELSHGLDASLLAIEAISNTKTYTRWRTPLSKVATALQEGRIPNTYAACFCSDPDALSQWRGYGGSEQGISVTFDRGKLSSILKDDKATFCRIIYSNVTTKQKMVSALKSELADLTEINDLIGDMSKSEQMKAAYDIVCQLLPRFKHLGFKDEREFRFVIQQDTLSDNVCFRDKGNVIVPYLKAGPQKKSKMPITSITIGPGKDQNLTEKSVRLYLDHKGYKSTTIKLSSVPFRT